VVVPVRCIPRAGRSGLAGLRGGALLVRLASAPVDGAANTELIAVLSDALGVPRKDLSILSGERSRTKRVLVAGTTADALRRALSAILGG
jgi:uncharacterized protein (TIGR00251 family)